MKKFLIIFLLFLLPTNVNAKIFELSKCYIQKGLVGTGYPNFKKMKSRIFMSKKTKENLPNDAVIDLLFQINTNKGTIKRIWHFSDEYAAQQAKDKKEGPLNFLDGYKDATQFSEKFSTTTYKLNNYVSGIVEGYIPKEIDSKIRIDINKSEIFESFIFDGAELTSIYRCEKGGKRKSHYLDYWWAVILIIAITFFIFTQSGKRLKKIRRK